MKKISLFLILITLAPKLVGSTVEDILQKVDTYRAGSITSPVLRQFLFKIIIRDSKKLNATCESLDEFNNRKFKQSTQEWYEAQLKQAATQEQIDNWKKYINIEFPNGLSILLQEPNLESSTPNSNPSFNNFQEYIFAYNELKLLEPNALEALCPSVSNSKFTPKLTLIVNIIETARKLGATILTGDELTDDRINKYKINITELNHKLDELKIIENTLPRTNRRKVQKDQHYLETKKKTENLIQSLKEKMLEEEKTRNKLKNMLYIEFPQPNAPIKSTSIML
jgi:hypothetical protein